MELRIARHTRRLDEIVAFYSVILGFDVLGSFRGHDGYDGVFMGIEGLGWHLEFTSSAEAPSHYNDEDDLLVFYPSTMTQYNAIVGRLEGSRAIELVPKNPYWRINGKLFKDPDDFGIIISSLRCIS